MLYTVVSLSQTKNLWNFLRKMSLISQNKPLLYNNDSPLTSPDHLGSAIRASRSHKQWLITNLHYILLGFKKPRMESPFGKKMKLLIFSASTIQWSSLYILLFLQKKQTQAGRCLNQQNACRVRMRTEVWISSNYVKIKCGRECL